MKSIQFIIAIILFPLSVWYAVGVAVRNMFFKLGILKSQATAIPTIGIGNLRMGGTGKTPHTEYLIRMFGEEGIALLSRGYGRKTHGFQQASSQRGEAAYAGSAAAILGDEPAMMARKFPHIAVAVCEDRLEGVDRLARLPQPPRLVLLDDVYQHRSISTTLSILLTEYSDLFSDDHILPFGNLREFRSGRCRADIVVVTKCPPSLSERKRSEYRKRLKLRVGQELFFSRIDYGQPHPLFGGVAWQPVREVLLLTGIAHPEPLKRHLERQCTVRHLAYPDHHSFTAADGGHIVKTFESIKTSPKAIVTTEKDSVRLLSPPVSEQLQQLPVFVIPIRVVFSEGNLFDETVRNRIELYNQASF